MKTFLLENGDLVIGEGGFIAITGPAKVRQDLAVSMKEPFGIDRFHPRWGSQLHEYIGGTVGPETHMFIEGEVNRLVQNYVYLQRDQVEKDLAEGRVPRFSTGELVRAVESIKVRQSYDSFKVRVSLRTISGSEVVLTQSVTTEGNI